MPDSVDVGISRRRSTELLHGLAVSNHKHSAMAQMTGVQPGAALLQSSASVQRVHRQFSAACPARSRRSQITCSARSEYDGPVALPRRQLIAAGVSHSHRLLIPAACRSPPQFGGPDFTICTTSRTHCSCGPAGGLLAPLAWAMPTLADDSYIPVKSLSGFQRGDQRAYFQVGWRRLNLPYQVRHLCRLMHEARKTEPSLHMACRPAQMRVRLHITPDHWK